jgi:hypothetical protein
MLFLLFGASGAGKTAALEAVRGRSTDLVCHDFDEVGVPPRADRRWRQEANEAWLVRVLEYEDHGRDVLLAGQTPYGELLATPSADELEILGMLLDCADDVREARLRGRSGIELEDQLAWAAWLRGHATDPQWLPEVIQAEAREEMRWDRWRDWKRGDQRWRVVVLDTSTLTVDRVAGRVLAWTESSEPLASGGI